MSLAYRLRAIAASLVITAASGIMYCLEDTSPQFDAASIREVEGPSGVFFGPRPVSKSINDPDRIFYEWTTLRTLILRAYAVSEYQIAWPEWLDRYEHPIFYQLSATMPPGTTQEQLRFMFQNLLAERFKLVVHHELKNMPVYALRIAETGMKIHEVPAPQDGAIDGVSMGPEGIHFYDKAPKQPSSGQAWAGGMKISRILNWLNNSRVFDAPVLDMANLTGYYDIDLVIPRGVDVDASVVGMGSIVSASDTNNALKKQLGLTIRKEHLPTDVLVIDHLEKVPTPN